MSASGGTLPYSSVEWFQGVIGSGSSTGVTGFTNSALCPGQDYYAIVTDANGCTKDFQINPISSPAAISINATTTDLDCHGNGNGAIDATYSGGTGLLSPSWTIITPGSGLIPNTEDQITLSGGVYQLLVTDGNGCVDSVQYTIDEPDTIVSNGVVTDISCYDQIDGAINLNLTGGATPYSSISVSYTHLTLPTKA